MNHLLTQVVHQRTVKSARPFNYPINKKKDILADEMYLYETITVVNTYEIHTCERIDSYASNT